jgi:hypothetical protein
MVREPSTDLKNNNIKYYFGEKPRKIVLNHGKVKSSSNQILLSMLVVSHEIRASPLGYPPILPHDREDQTKRHSSTYSSPTLYCIRGPV